MMDRPEPLDFLISISYTAKHDTTYQITYRAHQLQAMRDYIKELEKKVQDHEHR
jgi:hypothetical protein